MLVRFQFSPGCYEHHIRAAAGFTTRPLRPPFLGSIRLGTRYAPILLSKNSARKSGNNFMADYPPSHEATARPARTTRIAKGKARALCAPNPASNCRASAAADASLEP